MTLFALKCLQTLVKNYNFLLELKQTVRQVSMKFSTLQGHANGQSRMWVEESETL